MPFSTSNQLVILTLGEESQYRFNVDSAQAQGTLLGILCDARQTSRLAAFGSGIDCVALHVALRQAAAQPSHLPALRTLGRLILPHHGRIEEDRQALN